MDKITLDREVFKALASDTRLDILKALDVRQKTVTELAKELNLNKATVFEHLEKLAAVELIQKLEDDRKWVYWQLSWKGRRLLHPEKITLALLLSSAFGTLLTAFAAAWLWWRSGNLGGPAQEVGADAMGAPVSEEAGASSASQENRAALYADEVPPAADPDPVAAASTESSDPLFLALAIVLALACLALVVGSVWYWRRRRAQQAATETAPA